MNKYFIDESEVFAVNENLDAKVELMGSEKKPIVYIDNFYKNPDTVRELAISIPPTFKRRICGGLPGARVSVNFDLDHLIHVWMDIAKQVYGLDKSEEDKFKESCERLTFCVNVTAEEQSRIPHVDYPREVTDLSRGWAGVIYLNIPEECHGGTGFYTYNGKSCPDGSEEDFWDDEIVNDSVGPWELVHLAEMKYNRLIFYPDNFFHSVYQHPGHFKHSELKFRLAQSIFLPIPKS
jgi:hypothetical protein